MRLPININDFLNGKPVEREHMEFVEAMEKNGSPPAEFEFDEDHSYFMVRLPIHPAALEVAESQARLESRSESGLESETSRGVLLALATGSLARSDIAKRLGHERVSGAINRAIKELLAKGLIEYTLPEKPNSRLQKYRRVQNKAGAQ